jgi:hypothetical protein
MLLYCDRTDIPRTHGQASCTRTNPGRIIIGNKIIISRTRRRTVRPFVRNIVKIPRLLKAGVE